MGLADVIPYFRERLNILGFSEWPQPFSFDNIPNNIIDNSYNIVVGSISGGPANHQAFTFEIPTTVRVLKKGFREPLKSRDKSLETADKIYGDLLAAQNRLNATGIKDVRPTNSQPVQLSETQDNIIILEMNFTTIVISCF